MGILRTDLLTHSQLQPSGSVALDGTDDYLSIASHSSFAYGTSDFTWELWVYSDDLSSSIYMLDHGSGDAGMIQYFSNIIRYYNGTTGSGSALYTGGGSLTESVWHHIAVVRNNGFTSLYVDGELRTSGSDSHNYPAASLSIGDYGAHTGNYEWTGNISNVRITRRAVYKQNFTVPKFELKNIAGTVLLCAQSSSSATTAEVTPGTITAAGNATASAFSPDLKKDITDTGVVFDGFGSFATSTYMVPPSGNTEQRNRGRGLVGGGYSPSVLGQIYSVEIASDGTSADFGDLSLARRGTGAVGSHTRGIWAGGYAPGYQDRIDFVTFANEATAIDFGNLDTNRFETSGVSNDTRGVYGPSENPTADQSVIQYITMATAGNAIDFGDSTVATKKQASMNSTTRGLFAGGQNVPSPLAYYDIIDKITIASTGNAADFGDLTENVFMCTGVCDSTRGIRGGGAKSPSPANTNTMDYVTIASDGNATDFGDLTTANQRSGGMSNSKRGIFAGGATPNSTTFINSIDKITIQTQGNATDFGDYIGTAANQGAGCSDSHGGLS